MGALLSCDMDATRSIKAQDAGITIRLLFNLRGQLVRMSIAPKEIPVNSVKWTEDLRWQARRAVELAVPRQHLWPRFEVMI